MAALNVNVEITDVQVNPNGNNYTSTATLAPGDTSGLSNFTLTWTGPGTTPRYAPGATGTIILP
jgi:hypothetical protein